MKEIKEIKEINAYLSKCIKYVDNRELITEQIEKIKKMKGKISLLKYNKVMKFVEKKIRPIANNPHYFEFLFKEEYGYFNEKDNSFIFYNAMSEEYYIFEKYHYILELESNLKCIFKKIFKVDYTE